MNNTRRVGIATVLVITLAVSITSFNIASGATVPDTSYADDTAMELLTDEINAVGQQEVFTDFLGEVIEAHGQDVVDHAWHGDFGTVVVKPKAAEAVKGIAETQSVKIVVQTAQPVQTDGNPTLELKVVEVLMLNDSYSKSARYERDTNKVVVTIYTDGESLSADRLSVLQTVAESVTDGIAVVIEVSTESPPVAAI